MKQIVFILSIALSALTIASCSGANENSASNSNSNNNTAIVTINNTNPIANVNAGVATTTGNSNIPGIPNVPGTDKPISKDDPTRNAKVQTISRPAPDNSEILGPTLGADLVETRVFKNNAQIAKIEVIGTSKKTVKVYLRNGQVRELAEGKVADPLSESGANIFQALSSDAPAKTATKNSQPSETAPAPKK